MHPWKQNQTHISIFYYFLLLFFLLFFFILLLSLLSLAAQYISSPRQSFGPHQLSPAPPSLEPLQLQNLRKLPLAHYIVYSPLHTSPVLSLPDNSSTCGRYKCHPLTHQTDSHSYEMDFWTNHVRAPMATTTIYTMSNRMVSSRFLFQLLTE